MTGKAKVVVDECTDLGCKISLDYAKERMIAGPNAIEKAVSACMQDINRRMFSVIHQWRQPRLTTIQKERRCWKPAADFRSVRREWQQRMLLTVMSETSTLTGWRRGETL